MPLGLRIVNAAPAIFIAFSEAFAGATPRGERILASISEHPLGPAAFLAWFGCLIGIYVFGQGLFMLRRRRRARIRPVSTIRDAGPGQVHVAGMAEGKIPLKAPISGKACFYFRTLVWRREDSSKDGSSGNASWKLAAEETIAKPFLLNDTTGRILVDPVGADMDWPHDFYEEYGKTLLATHTDIPEALEEFLARHKVKPGASLRVEEYLIAPGAEVFVRGMKSANPEFCAVAPAPVVPKRNFRVHDQTVASQATQVIRLSPEPPALQAREMTMQSRLAAALAMARANAAAANPADTSVIPGVTTLVTEEPRVGAASPATASLSQPHPGTKKGAVSKQGQLRAKAAETLQDAEMGPPPFVVRKPAEGSEFTISYRTGKSADFPSWVRMAALLIGGPLLAVVSIGSLLATFGLF